MMTFEIGLTLGILVVAVYLFISEKIRMDVVAVGVLVLLALFGLVSPAEALSGFSNPAVVTVWAVFILSGALSRTGVANLVGRQIIRVAGSGEARLITVIMLTTAFLSALMNNVGIAAQLLPVVVSIARRTGRHPSRLLMPLATGSLLGGMMTLIGTPPNILASNALRDAGFEPFALFDFLPVGGILTLVGVLYMLTLGRRLLPSPGDAEGAGGFQAQIQKTYVMQERVAQVRIPANSPLSGLELSDTRLSAALGLTVLSVNRAGQPIVPAAGTQLKEGDLLTVTGRLDSLEEVRGRQYLVIENEDLNSSDLVSEGISLVGLRITENSSLLGSTLRQLDFRHQFGLIVLALSREGDILRTGFDRIPLRVGDVLLGQGPTQTCAEVAGLPEFSLEGVPPLEDFRIDERLVEVRIPQDSPLVGKVLAESKLAEMVGLTVTAIVRDGEVRMLVDPRATTLQEEDRLYVKGRARENLQALIALQDLRVEAPVIESLGDLETEEVGLLEVVLSPHSSYAGKTLGQIEFRARYGLNVIALFRDGRAYRSSVNSFNLRFGDALLLHGSRDKLRLIAQDPNFISLADDVQPSPLIKKAPLSIGIMIGVIFTVLMGWLPISVAAITGSLLMVLTGCLTMDEAYRDIEWRAVFLIAGMLPLGIAMETTGTAQMLANAILSTIGQFGVLPMIGGLFVMTALAAQVMPNPVVVLLMAPISLAAAGDAAISPYAIMMVIAIGASASFLSPVGHPANLLVMGPGGYSFRDFVRVGVPLLILILGLVLFVLPVFWPLGI